MVLFLKHILLCRSLLSFFHQGEVHVAAVDIDLGTLYPNSVAQAIALAALFFLNAMLSSLIQSLSGREETCTRPSTVLGRET